MFPVPRRPVLPFMPPISPPFVVPPRSIMRRRIPTAALLLPLAAACSDAFVESGRVPTRLALGDTVVTTALGERVRIPVTVLDQDGVPFERVPAWATPVWTTSSAATVRVQGGELLAVSSGQAVASVEVAGLTATARVRVNPREVRMRIEGVQLTQAAQPWGGTAPLVAGRDALLRVYMTGDRPSFFAPRVRVKVYSGATLVETLTTGPAEVREVVAEQEMAGSWNVVLPARLVQPGLRVRVEADPDGTVPLAAGSEVVFPAGGEPLAADVRDVPPFDLRLVPVHQAGTGTTGGVDAGNAAAFLEPLRAMFPVREVNVDVRAPFTTTHVASTQAGWTSILRELNALRVAEGTSRYYYGVLTRPAAGIAGMGYLGVPAALGFDRLPDAAQTLAHELGHNFGRAHAPCGNPSGPDPAFPTANAVLDVVGIDVGVGAVRGDAYRDLMSYCVPEWITWYTYRAILDYRHAHDWPAPAAAARAPEPVLLVWGTVRDGEVVLEPAVELTAPASMPAGPGPYRIEARDASGATLYAFSFRGAEVMDLPEGERHFAFAVPTRVLPLERVASLRLVAGGREASVRRAGGAVDARTGPRFSIAAPAGGRAEVRWEAARAPLAVVRDGRTGEILAFARGGAASVRTDAPELEVLFSDGVRTTARRVRVRP